MMHPAAFQLTAELGGTLLSGAAGGMEGGLLLVERIKGHGLPQVAVLGRGAAEVLEPLEAAERVQAEGLEVNLLALVPLPGCDLAVALTLHRRRIGALVAALDVGLPWLGGKPMLARRLPGRIRLATPVPLAKAPKLQKVGGSMVTKIRGKELLLGFLNELLRDEQGPIKQIHDSVSPFCMVLRMCNHYNSGFFVI